MSRGVTIHGDITPDQIAELLTNAFPEKSVEVSKLFIEPEDTAESKNHSDKFFVTPISGDLKMRKELEEKKKELKAADDNIQKLNRSIQTFHKQQQALFDEFVLLRQRYDEQRTNTVEILWTHCAKYHPDLRLIPSVENEEFIEKEDRVGDLHIGELLGEGQFANVKSCFHDETGVEYAIKVITKERITNFTSLMRVSNEIDNLTKLRSPYIINVEQVFHTEKILYIVTEKGGRDLFEFFDEHPDGVPELWAKQIITCILKGVLYCHEQGICHRDLKPENILLTYDSDAEVCKDCKLCDFGLSTKFKTNVLLTDFCGSPGFFAPEMIMHGSYYGDKADVWSVGCILLELVAGHERFCDLWMSAYDYEILQSQENFTRAIEETVNDLPNNLSFSPQLNDFILRFLVLRSSKRPSLHHICAHPWLDGALAEELDLHKKSSKMNLDMGARKLSSHMSMRISPSNSIDMTNDKTFGAQAAADALKSGVSQEKLMEVFLNLSDKERRHLEEYIIHHKKTDTDNNQDLSHGHHEMHLPPITPATPSIGNAKKILRKGAELVNRAQLGPHSGNGMHSPVSTFSSPDVSHKHLSPPPSRLNNSALPGLSEAPNESVSLSVSLDQTPTAGNSRAFSVAGFSEGEVKSPMAVSLSTQDLHDKKN